MRPLCWRFIEWRLKRLPTDVAREAAGDLLEDYQHDLGARGQWSAEWQLLRDAHSVVVAHQRDSTAAGTSSGRTSAASRVTDALRATSLDVRVAVRALGKQPWYAATLIGVVALGITLATTVIAIVDGALFKPLPYADVDRLFAVTTGYSAIPGSTRFGTVSPMEFSVWKNAIPEARFASFSRGRRATVGPNDDSVRSVAVDASFFDVLGAPPQAGGFGPGDFDGALPVSPAIVTQEFFVRRLGGEPDALGRVLLGEAGRGVRVAGVLPEGFVMPDVLLPEVLTPLQPADPTQRGRSLLVVMRLPPAITVAEASARLTAAQRRVHETWPARSLPPSATERQRILAGGFDEAGVMPMRIALTSSYRQTAWIVFGAAVFLVALACLNVMGMAVARVQERWPELSVRRSLGARHLDLLRLLAVENGLLMAAGLVSGVLVAPITVGVTAQLTPSYLRLFKAPVVDGRVVVMVAAAAAVSLALVTVVSARAAWRAGTVRGAVAAARVTRQRHPWILSAQVALGLVMAVGGSLVATGLLRVWAEDTGLPTEGTALLRMAPPRGSAAGEIERLVAEIRAIPGVIAAAGIHRPLLENAFNGSEFDRPEGVAYSEAESLPVTSGFFETAALTAITGRLPTDQELQAGAPVIVVSEVVAREFWPGRAATDQVLTHQDRPFAVVGVVRDIRQLALDTEPWGAIYWPLAAHASPSLQNVLLRFDDRVTSLSSISAQVADRCPACRFGEAQMLSDAMSATIRPRRFNAWLFASFGLAALAIVGAGVLGLVAMTTARRSREVGIRMALGSTAAGVVRQILQEQLRLLVVGLAVGGVAAAVLVRFVEAYLYETTPYDLSAWAAAVLALVLMTLVASLIPALRASRVNPVTVLREGM